MLNSIYVCFFQPAEAKRYASVVKELAEQNNEQIYISTKNAHVAQMRVEELERKSNDLRAELEALEEQLKKCKGR